MRLLSRWAFEVLSLGRLELTIAPDNVASHAVAQRAGYAREGVLRGYKHALRGRRDFVLYSLLATDTGAPGAVGT